MERPPRHPRHEKMVNCKVGVDLDVSKSRGFSPKSSTLIGFSIINHPFWGTQSEQSTNPGDLLCTSRIIHLPKVSRLA